jgi:sulfur relay (sulfurtransferase) complex TusBCD TusD component (DsrE family)
MNDGVKVPTLNEQAIEHLKELEEIGVELLVCGACLDFYGLQEKLSVGKVSNMYDIVEAMKSATKVITFGSSQFFNIHLGKSKMASLKNTQIFR